MGSLNKCVENGTRKHFAHAINLSFHVVSAVEGGFVLTVDANVIVRSAMGGAWKS